MSPNASSRLFQPLKVGNLNLQHRVIMAPLTRYRADANHVPLPMVAEYYAQRASVPGTLLITEATFITPQAGGYKHVPGIWSQAQIDAWRPVTDAVHAKGSFIYLQLWALGRAAMPQVLEAESGSTVVSASDLPIDASTAVPRPLSTEEISQYVADYAQAAKNAVAAGFDGVEIHGANGYLLDQFTQDVSNRRLDSYGGSIENRARFPLEVASAVVDAIGAARVGYRISPFNDFQAMGMADPAPQFTHLLKGLAALKLSYIHATESWRKDGPADAPGDDHSFIFDAWAGVSPVVLAGGYKEAKAFKAADELYKDQDVAVAFGRYFISTPDLVFRLKEGIDFNKYDRDTFYKRMSPDGYTDYPFSKEWAAVAA